MRIKFRRFWGSAASAIHVLEKNSRVNYTVTVSLQFSWLLKKLQLRLLIVKTAFNNHIYCTLRISLLTINVIVDSQKYQFDSEVNEVFTFAHIYLILDWTLRHTDDIGNLDKYWKCEITFIALDVANLQEKNV